jgi:class 3 adenylate cyclase
MLPPGLYALVRESIQARSSPATLAQLVFHTAAGDAINIAKRLEQNTGSGQIVFGDPVAKRLGAEFLPIRLARINIKEHGDPFGLFKVVTLLV